MKFSKLVVLLVLALLAMGGVVSVMAQDQLPATNLVIWSQDGDSNNEVLAAQFQIWADTVAPGSTLEIVQKETEVLRTDLQNAGLAGSGLPDLVLGPNDAIGVFVDAGIIQPLDELFDVSVYPFNLGAAQVGGATYGIPTNAGNHLMLMYNKSLVEAAPDTWVDLIATAKAVTEANPEVQGFAYNLNEPFWFLPFVHGFGGSTYDADGNMVLDSQAWIDAYQFVQDLKFTEQVVPEECDYACANDLFKEGSVAMIINGDWAIGEYLDAEQSPALGPDNLGLAPWPALANGNRPMPFTAGKFISIPVTVEGDQLAAAVSFVTWLTTDPSAVEAFALGTSRLPAIAEVTVDAAENPILAESAAALATGMGMPADATLRCMWDSVRPQLEAVMSNSMTPADAAEEAQISAEICLES
ncbi:MAG TPA: extracellular solute-binding protein [Aggregatilineales bacterium]|nr:extracellular solute-binding protein [Anaerolineae bacterium]HUN10430.1 extracellular solute-binding protein [Aggregatilineales bacterium]